MKSKCDRMPYRLLFLLESCSAVPKVTSNFSYRIVLFSSLALPIISVSLQREVQNISERIPKRSRFVDQSRWVTVDRKGVLILTHFSANPDDYRRHSDSDSCSNSGSIIWFIFFVSLTLCLSVPLHGECLSLSLSTSLRVFSFGCLSHLRGFSPILFISSNPTCLSNKSMPCVPICLEDVLIWILAGDVEMNVPSSNPNQVHPHSINVFPPDEPPTSPHWTALFLYPALPFIPLILWYLSPMLRFFLILPPFCQVAAGIEKRV